MVGKEPAVGIGKRPEKILVWWEISLRGKENVFRCTEHLALRQPSYTVDAESIDWSLFVDNFFPV